MLRKVTIGAGMLGAMVAYGQPQDDAAKAQAKYEEAERYYKLGEFDTALKLYRESYLLSGAPELLFNIGQCHRQLKRYEEAIKNYKAYLRDVPDTPSRPEVERLIAESESRLAQPATAPTTAPATAPVTAPTSSKSAPSSEIPVAPRAPFVVRLWKESAFGKVGYLSLGASIPLGALSLIRAKQANEAGDDLLQIVEKKGKAEVLAVTSDVLLLAGLGFAGYAAAMLKYQSKHVPLTTIGVSQDGAQVILSLEF